MTLFLALFNLTFATPLSPLQWAVLAGIPVGIIILYFLKLRRKPVQVSSTLLWRKSLEDLHVNSLFQRLRKNLLLFLQLLILFLAMFALAGPRFKGTSTQGQRYVLAMDESASMTATDVSPSRLDRAKREAKKIVDGMERDDLAMIVAFSDRARVVSNYTANRTLLKQRIDAIEPTQNTTNLREALQVVAGLAVPTSDRDAREGSVATDSMIPPRLTIFTDGGFPDVEGFSIGKIEPNVVVIGPPRPALAQDARPGVPSKASKNPSDNVAILALSSARNDDKPEQFQVFGRVKNFRDEEVKTQARLIRHDPKKPGEKGTVVDVQALTIAPLSEQSFQFDLTENGMAELEVQIDVTDAFPLDNRAFTVFGNVRKAQILVVTSGDRYLRDAFETFKDVADVTEITPVQSQGDDVKREIGSGKFDLILYDGERPATAPEANALYFGVLPPGKAFDNGKEVEGPTILDWDVAHPTMQYVRDLGSVIIQKAITCEPPNGSTKLIDSNKGVLAFVSPRGGFVDVVIGFRLLDGAKFNTNWQLLRSFPLFLFNTVRALGNARDTSASESHLPDQPIALRADTVTDAVEVFGPNGVKIETLKRSPQGTFLFTKAKQTGFYQVRWGKGESSSFAVNLFDPRESDLAPRGLAPEGLSEDAAEPYKIKIGFTSVKGQAGKGSSIAAVKDWWMYLAAAMLGVVLLEWYIYNRRVYV